MHIASALTLVRRAPAQSEAPFQTPEATRTVARTTGLWTRKALPGGILLTILILLGALLPVVF